MTPEQRFCARVSNNRVACAGRQWQEFLDLVGREPPRVSVLTSMGIEAIAARTAEIILEQLQAKGPLNKERPTMPYRAMPDLATTRRSSPCQTTPGLARTEER